MKTVACYRQHTRCFLSVCRFEYPDIYRYEHRVRTYEDAGMTRSDAQAVVDCEIKKEQST